MNKGSCTHCYRHFEQMQMLKEELKLSKLNVETSQSVIETLEQKDRYTQDQFKQYKYNFNKINDEFEEKYKYLLNEASDNKILSLATQEVCDAKDDEIKILKQQLEEFNTECQKIEITVKDLQNKNTDLQTKVIDLQGINTSQKEKETGFQAIIDKQKTELQEKNTEMEKLQEELKFYKFKQRYDRTQEKSISSQVFQSQAQHSVELENLKLQVLKLEKENRAIKGVLKGQKNEEKFHGRKRNLSPSLLGLKRTKPLPLPKAPTKTASKSITSEYLCKLGQR